MRIQASVIACNFLSAAGPLAVVRELGRSGRRDSNPLRSMSSWVQPMQVIDNTRHLCRLLRAYAGAVLQEDSEGQRGQRADDRKHHGL
jgi:hypothetical protein